MPEDIVTIDEIRKKRDAKVHEHLAQYAPVWMVEEVFIPQEEAVQFNVLFQHPTAGQDGTPAWVSRRYRYDAFNNTLYHKGQNLIDEDTAEEITEAEPYLSANIADIPNSYGG
ncbi:MAG: hypothetical protein KC546_08055 [Anaerolineae bacterium]|nr:hypothetical protein [Anaerolineae bacterium]MCA9888311.1 hypothetical protein [Anaerolineae bacterium]MCA9892143.1 hypothetical protein [Anaerolineae bacterium]MCB9459994.1 hypothetical protein [Anaerolineaceae bacterium]